MSVDISIVIPVYNEERNITPLYNKIVSILKPLKKTFELMFVDDGSVDHTFGVIRSLHKKDSRIRVIRFQRNFGKSAAYMASFKECEGRIIITMDGDLQDDPAEIPRMMEALKRLDLVVGWKFPRRDSISRTIPSKIFNRLNYKFFDLKLHDYDCGYRAMKSEVVQDLNLYGDLYRYIPALVSRAGFKVGEIKVRHHPRKFGKSKYGSKRLLTGALDLLTVKFITDFNQRPLHLFGVAGTIFFILGVIADLFVLSYKIFFGHSFSSHVALLILGVLLIILGIQFLGIGLIGELVSSSKRDINRYTIREKL